MYEHFNTTLWQDIQLQGDDFWDELEVYEKYLEKTEQYCDTVYKAMIKNVSQVYSLYKSMEPLILPETKWGPNEEIDPVWCLVSRIDIMPFYNILRVKQVPQVCQHLEAKEEKTNAYTFRINNEKKSIQMSPHFCARNAENLLVPLQTLAAKGQYMWT